MLSVSLTPKASLFQGKGGSGWNVDAKEVEFDSSAPAQQSQFLTSAMTESVNRSLSGGGAAGPPVATVVTCDRGHTLQRNPKRTHMCDVCGSVGTQYRCDSGRCDYDMCEDCFARKSAPPAAPSAMQFGGAAGSGFGTTWVEKKAGSGDMATVCLFGADSLPRSGTIMVEIIFKHTRKHSLAD